MKLKPWLTFFNAKESALKEDENVKSSNNSDHIKDAVFTDIPPALNPQSAMLAIPTDEKIVARWGGRVLFFSMLLVLVWVVFAPLSQGVPAHGFIKVEGNRKTIQHLKGGIVETILVKEGDSVKANQALITLNDTQLKSQQALVEGQLVIALGVEARLSAERNNADRITFPAFLLQRENQQQTNEAMQVQMQLFSTRRAAVKGEEAIGLETISGLKEQIRGLIAQEASKAAQFKSFDAEMKTLKPLYEDGYIPRNRLFELERAVAYLSGQRSDDVSNIGRVKSQITETKLKVLQGRGLYQKEVETQLTDAQSKVADLKERLVATEDELNRVVLRAPNAGIVVDLTAHTIGGVIAPGQKLMDIVPEGGGVVIEAQIPTHLIDKVHAGLEADVHFTALDQTLVPTIPGKLIYVSADRMTDPRTDAPYFIGRVVVTEAGMKMLGKNSLQPGMPADVVLKMSNHSLMGYMLKPMLNRLRFAFTER